VDLQARETGGIDGVDKRHILVQNITDEAVVVCAHLRFDFDATERWQKSYVLERDVLYAPTPHASNIL
jgi:hypothetical protein